LRTPSVEIKYWEAEVDEVSVRVIWKFCNKEIFALPKGIPPLSSNKTLNF
jgi:hypothetical protein